MTVDVHVIREIFKHLAGRHDQLTHAGNREGTGYVDDIRLTRREQDILQGFVLFPSAEDVASVMGLDDMTIFNAEAGVIYNKIGVQNRQGAALWALTNGIIERDSIPFDRHVLTSTLSSEQLGILRDLAAQRTKKMSMKESGLDSKTYDEAIKDIREQWQMPDADLFQLVVAAYKGGFVDIDDANQIRKEDIAAGRNTRGVKYVEVGGKQHRLSNAEERTLQNILMSNTDDDELTRSTVASSRSMLYSKLNAANNTHLVVRGIVSGLIKPDDKLVPMPSRDIRLLPTEKELLEKIAAGSYRTHLTKEHSGVSYYPIKLRRIKDKFGDENLTRIAITAWKSGLIDIPDLGKYTESK